jgi:hypothetical protein
VPPIVEAMPRLRIALAVALAFALAVPAALACGRGYSYAGLYAPRRASGVAATLSMLDQPSVSSGHVGAWVGVGGARLGPKGTDEWLQVGLASFAGSAEGHLYYEVARPGREPQYHELASGIQPQERLRVAVLELPFARDTWIVGSDKGFAGPFYLPKSHRAWAPIATAESWNDGGGACNRYAYRFGGVQLQHRDGRWKPLRHGLKLEDPGLRLHRTPTSTFSVTAD